MFQRVVTLVLLLAACGGRRHDAVDAGAGHDATTGQDGAAELDAAAAGDDAGPLMCDCAARVPVGMFHACTPPLEMGCAIQTCTPGGDECPAGDTCVECAAAACCECAACVPACIHTEASPGGALPALLKLRSVYGAAGQPAELVVEGAPFYVGALGYSVRAGDSEDLQQEGGEPCSLTAIAPAEPAGTMLAVWVSQYGLGEPWVLAGFFSWIAGDQYPTCLQPGMPCDDAERTCCETSDAPMSCQAGRCQRG